MLKPRKSGTANREENDAYFTSHETVALVVNKICETLFLSKSDLLVDSSAGDNRFVRLLKIYIPGIKCASFDINPRDVAVKEQDWLQVTKGQFNRPICLAFNPPFGLSSKMIKLFIAHAIEIADVTKMVLIHPTIDLPYITPVGYSVVYTEILPAFSFERPNGRKYDANCSFSFFWRDAIQPISCVFKPRNKCATDNNYWIKYTQSGKLSRKHQMLVRRVGVNFLRQAYIVDNLVPLYYIENGSCTPTTEFMHKVDCDGFYKCEILDRNVDIVKTCINITASERDARDLLKKPNSIAHENMNKVLSQAVVYKK